jgi:hypothetical protein
MATAKTTPPGEEVPEWLLDPLWDKEEGHIEALGNDRYLVKGRTRGYGVNWTEKTCGCPHHQYRMVSGELCRHLEMVRDHLKANTESAAADEMSDEELRALFA